MTVDQQVEKARTLRVDTSKTDEQKQREQIMDLLSAASGKLTTNETGIAFHVADSEAPLISIRQGTAPARAAVFLNDYVVSQAKEAVFELPPEIRCRPMDGAVNLDALLRRIYGMGSVGKEQRSMFGTTPPMTLTVETGLGQHASVPWGLIDFPDFEGELYLGEKTDPVYGLLFHAYVKCPKKYEAQIEGFWKLLEDQIKNHSIYKGKAIVGVGKTNRDGSYEHPKFIDPYAIDPNKVAYSQDVFDALRASVWGPIRTALLQRAAGLSLNRKTLLAGTYGTGKSLAGGLTARTAVNNGWTFIQAKTGDEDLSMVLRTAEMLAPTVVFIEDIDIMMQADPKKMAELLEQFDGVSSKNKEVMVLMTSNFKESMSKGMTRSGRTDAIVEVGDLDAEAISRLLRNAFENQTPYDSVDDDRGVYESMSKEITREDLYLPENMLSSDVDFDRVQAAMEGYEPAFIMGTFNLAKSNGIVRTESLNFKLTTEDFVLAANTLRNQHETHKNASDRPAVDVLGQVLTTVMEEAAATALQDHRVDFRENGDIVAVG